MGTDSAAIHICPQPLRHSCPFALTGSDNSPVKSAASPSAVDCQFRSQPLMQHSARRTCAGQLRALSRPAENDPVQPPVGRSQLSTVIRAGRSQPKASRSWAGHGKPVRPGRSARQLWHPPPQPAAPRSFRCPIPTAYWLGLLLRPLFRPAVQLPFWDSNAAGATVPSPRRVKASYQRTSSCPYLPRLIIQHDTLRQPGTSLRSKSRVTKLSFVFIAASHAAQKSLGKNLAVFSA